MPGFIIRLWVTYGGVAGYCPPVLTKLLESYVQQSRNDAYMLHPILSRFMSTKTNTLKKCRDKRRCKAKGTGLCNPCSLYHIGKTCRADPAWRTRQVEASRENMRRLWNDPQYRIEHSEIASETARRLNADPEFKEAARIRAKALSADPKVRAKISETIRVKLADPLALAELTTRFQRAVNTPEVVVRRRAALIKRGRWLTEEQKDMVARQVANTTEPMKQIGKRWLRTCTQIAAIAASRGVVRGRNPGCLDATARALIAKRREETGDSFCVIGRDWQISDTQVRRIVASVRK